MTTDEQRHRDEDTGYCMTTEEYIYRERGVNTKYCTVVL